jgi:hypothetical protein
MGQRYRSFGMRGKFKTHCVHGHDLRKPGAVYSYNHPIRGRFRICKRCTRKRARARSQGLSTSTAVLLMLLAGWLATKLHRGTGVA